MQKISFKSKFCFNLNSLTSSKKVSTIKNTHKLSNDEQELSIDERELSIDEQELDIDEQDMINIEQASSNGTDLELYSNYELDFQENSEK
ncbi:hypothetical protein F8M41_026275 [Gigaspora margarita]|uniref:Uncharacterized protein n=1 Tax=Gigaspora margarita TaxID=4874 RepID=A0A8H4AAF0_GIGMA|nr:hypothetical protein F8M41_026275 [Gigaspora margarita]